MIMNLALVMTKLSFLFTKTLKCDTILFFTIIGLCDYGGVVVRKKKSRNRQKLCTGTNKK